MSNTKKNIVILISGNGSNLQAIIDKVKTGEIKANISAVISNKKNVFGLKRAEIENIPSHIVEHTQYNSREAFDTALSQIIDNYSADIIVLAGFMRILSSGFVLKYIGKLINIHPSLLPLYRGLHTHKRVLEDKAKQHGASVHFVTPELDAGSVLIQGIVDIKAGDTIESLAKRVHIIEHIIYPAAIKLLTENAVNLEQENIFINGKLLQQPKKYYLNKAPHIKNPN